MTERQKLKEGDLLTVPQARRLAPIGRSTLYAVIESGQIPHYRISATACGPGRILIRRADLEAFIEKSRVGGPS